MKRTFPANIDGQIFYIDEDAFNLLQNYLHQLKSAFKSTEGEEIVGDIESRIRELFAETIARGANVITIADVEKVIATMGRPEDLSDDYGDDDSGAPDSDNNKDSDDKKDKKDTDAGGGDAPKGRTINIPFPSLPANKKLYRNMQNKVFGGVVGGLATYLGWNANIMRLLLVVLAIFTQVFPLLFAYLIAWMIIPAARSPRQVLEMYGKPVNVDTLGKAVINDSMPVPPPIEEDGRFITSFLSSVGKCVLAFFGFIAGCATIGFAIIFLCLSTGLVVLATTNNDAIFDLFNIESLKYIQLWAVTVGSLLATYVSALILWGASTVIFSLKGVSKATTVTLLAILAVLIAAVIILFALSAA